MPLHAPFVLSCLDGMTQEEICLNMVLYCVIHNMHRHLKAFKRINNIYLFSHTEKVLFLNTKNIEVNHSMKPNEKEIIIIFNRFKSADIDIFILM